MASRDQTRPNETPTVDVRSYLSAFMENFETAGTVTLSVRDRKIKLREEFKAKRKTMSAEERAVMDAEICRRVIALAGFRYSDTVLSYMPLPGEVDVRGINLAALESGKTLCLPRCIPGTPIMEFRVVRDFDDLETGSFSILEPSEKCPLWVPPTGGAEQVFCLIPGMAYDLHGNRLGYGKGYYDRYLSSCNVIKAGVAYSPFVVRSLPKGRFDLTVDFIVTEKRVFSTRVSTRDRR